MEEVKAVVYVKMDEQGRILIPKTVKEVMGLKAGDRFKLIAENGKITLIKIEG